MMNHRSVALTLLLACSFACSALAQEAAPAIKDVRFLPMTKIEQDALNDDSGKLHDLYLPLTPYNTARPKVPRRVDTFGDRKEYLADDPVGQFLVYFIGQDYTAPGAALKIEVVPDVKHSNELPPTASLTITPLTSPKVAFLLETGKLSPGSYAIRATLVNVPNARQIPEYTFTKSAKPHDHVIDFPPEGVPLVVHEQSQIPDAVWPITTGVPLPRHAADSTDRFELTENGKPVPAQWTTRATWYPDGSQLKWMGLDFEAKYDNGKPREYKVVRLPQGQKALDLLASPLKVTQDDESYTIDTGAIRFVVSKHHFAGVEKAWLVDPDGSRGSLVIDGGSGPSGPFLRDERDYLYQASADDNATVTVEESGLVRVTLYATGWYTSVPNAHQDAYGGEKCCLFQTRITAYAGLPDIDFHQRTVITYDTDQKKLRQLSFGIGVKGAEKYSLGGDGKIFDGELPREGVDKNKKPVPAASVWLHQDRFDHFRVVEGDDKPLGEGKQTDGWASLTLPDAAVTLTARNLWQLYPKEIELSRDGLTFHAWPRHGHVAFTEAESLDDHNYYKLFYAHQGQYMDLKLPQSLFEGLRQLSRAEGYFPVLEQQDINALAGNAQGTAITNDFRLHFASNAHPADPARLAALYQQNPHAITDPIYNGLTDVEGRFAGRDVKRFPDLEYMFDTAYRGHMISIPYLGDYGMWIWPDTHNNWNLLSRTPEMHRWWLNSHYQNVWEDTFLYFRSGLPWIGQWAADNSQHYFDIGTVNYNDPRHPLQGKLKGAEYHVKGFTPWGSPRYGEQTGDDYVEIGAHFINPDAGMFRYLLMGDHTGLDLMQAWGNDFGLDALPPERSRECVTTLGEMLSYYVNTWDPQALLYIHDLVSDIDSHPWKEDPNFPDHPLFHDRWVIRYWELTRDTQVRDHIMEWLKPGLWPDFPQVHALAFEWTGDKRFLTDIEGSWAGLHHGVYDNKDNPADPLNGYCGMGYFFPTPSIGETAPFYMQALIDNGLTLPTDAPDSLFSPTAAVTHPKKDARPASWIVLGPGRGYPNSQLAFVKANGAKPVITLSISTYGRPLAGTINPSYLRITDANGKIVYEDTLLCGSLKDKAAVTLDAKANPGPWKFRSGSWVMLSWTGSAESITVAPTAEQADAGK